MSNAKRHTIVGIITISMCLIFSLIVGIVTSNAVAVVLTSFLTAFLGVLVDIRVSYSDLITNIDPTLTTTYERFRNDKSALFRQVAADKYHETELFFRNLIEGRIEVSDRSKIMEILEFLFVQDAEIKFIVATSYGELDEWVATKSWMTNEQLRLHLRAHQRGVSVERIFLTESTLEDQLLRSACLRQTEHFVTALIGDPRRMSPEMLHRVGNASVYLDRHHNPVYAVRADHHNGSLDKVTYYRDQDHVRRIWDGYCHLRQLAMPYVPEDVQPAQ
jgi:hypothetical protein